MPGLSNIAPSMLRAPAPRRRARSTKTDGGQRRVNLVVLRHLLGDPTWHDVARIKYAQQIRELQKENVELRRQLRER
jgi:hypothetical protein